MSPFTVGSSASVKVWRRCKLADDGARIRPVDLADDGKHSRCRPVMMRSHRNRSTSGRDASRSPFLLPATRTQSTVPLQWLVLINSFMALACEYILFTLVFSSPRTNPTLPTTALPKPTALLITLIVCLVLHPLAILAGVAWKRTQEREGRIRLEEEAEQAHEEELEAEIRARLERERRQGVQA